MKKIKFPFVLFFLSISIGGYAQKKAKLPSILNEVSGVGYLTPDSIWWHNDGGHPAEIIQTNSQGVIIRQIPLTDVQNTDWEDLTMDDDGFIYIGDFGNNNNPRSQFSIYKYQPSTKSLHTLTYQYPNSKAPNVEAMIWSKGYLYLFTKDLLPKSRFVTYQYRLDDHSPDQVALLQDSLILKKRVVTGAAIHKESKRIALVSYRYHRILGFIPNNSATVYVIEHYEADNFLKGRIKKVKSFPFLAQQYESVDFINANKLLIASEKTPISAPKLKILDFTLNPE